jgi:hypothetical protein
MAHLATTNPKRASKVTLNELDELIAAQAKDMRTGDRVFSVSLERTLGEDRTLADVTEDMNGERILRPRSEHMTKRIKHLVGPRQRERQRRRLYAGTCEDCGKLTDGSNGRAKAPKVCAACTIARKALAYEALPHGDAKKYSGGCRCKPCRWAHARKCWDYQARRKARA